MRSAAGAVRAARDNGNRAIASSGADPPAVTEPAVADDGHVKAAALGTTVPAGDGVLTGTFTGAGALGVGEEPPPPPQPASSATTIEAAGTRNQGFRMLLHFSEDKRDSPRSKASLQKGVVPDSYRSRLRKC